MQPRSTTKMFGRGGIRNRARIEAADGVLIATPEYSYSIPGVLKNAIDWAARLPERPFEGKPTGNIGPSMGALGGRIRNSDADGNSTDQVCRDFLAAHLVAFKAWVLCMG